MISQSFMQKIETANSIPELRQLADDFRTKEFLVSMDDRIALRGAMLQKWLNIEGAEISKLYQDDTQAVCGNCGEPLIVDGLFGKCDNDLCPRPVHYFDGTIWEVVF